LGRDQLVVIDPIFASAAEAFAELVRRISPADWNGPGLGEWDLRSLVGHASRSLITVSTYLRSTADHEDVTGPVEYYTAVRDYLSTTGADEVVERGRQAGRDLGPDPVATIEDLLHTVLAELREVDDPLIAVFGGMGIRLSNYLPTRTFELAVHGLDIIAATGIAATLPTEVLEEATVLAARVGVALGSGESVLTSLTGRTTLPAGFSVV
jgi:uncharacterized protein (TIGR03083 family)